MNAAAVTTTYCDWNLPYGKPHSAAYDEVEARRRFEAGEEMTVLVGDPDRPAQVLEVNATGRVVTVDWLDELLRPVLTYVYAVKWNVDGWPADSLLLEQVAMAAYRDDTPLPEAESSYNETYYFHPDRKAYGVRAAKGEVPERTELEMDEEQFQAQLEPVPQFGDWASLLRQER